MFYKQSVDPMPLIAGRNPPGLPAEPDGKHFGERPLPNGH